MPHLIIEYSSDLEECMDMKNFMQTIYNAAVASKVVYQAE